MKYETMQCRGFWLPTNQTTKTAEFIDVLIATGSWDEMEDSEDKRIFYYMDGVALQTGDIISDGFVITEIN